MARAPSRVPAPESADGELTATSARISKKEVLSSCCIHQVVLLSLKTTQAGKFCRHFFSYWEEEGETWAHFVSWGLAKGTKMQLSKCKFRWLPWKHPWQHRNTEEISEFRGLHQHRRPSMSYWAGNPNKRSCTWEMSQTYLGCCQRFIFKDVEFQWFKGVFNSSVTVYQKTEEHQ